MKKNWSEIDPSDRVLLRVEKNDPWDMIYEMEQFICLAETYIGVSFGWEVKISRFHLAYYERTKQLMPAYYFDIDEWREHKKASWLRFPWPKDPEWVLSSLNQCIQYELKNGKTLEVRNREQWILERAIHEGFLEKPSSPRSGDPPPTMRIYLAGQAKVLRKIIERDYTTFLIIKTIGIWGEIPKEAWIKLGREYRQIYQTISDLVSMAFRTRRSIKMKKLRSLYLDYEELRRKGTDSKQIYHILGKKYQLKPQTVKKYLSEARVRLPMFDPRLGFFMDMKGKRKRRPRPRFHRR